MLAATGCYRAHQTLRVPLGLGHDAVTNPTKRPPPTDEIPTTTRSAGKIDNFPPWSDDAPAGASDSTGDGIALPDEANKRTPVAPLSIAFVRRASKRQRRR